MKTSGYDTGKKGVSSYFQTSRFKPQLDPLCLSFPSCRQQRQTLMGPVWVQWSMRTEGQRLFCLLLALAGPSFPGAGRAGGRVCLSARLKEDSATYTGLGEATAGPRLICPRPGP